MSGSASGSEQGMWRVRGRGDKRNPYEAGTMSTGYSSVNRGNIRIDPSIRSIQDQGLSRISGLYDQSGQYGDELIGNTRSLRNRFLGNQSAYAESQMNPLRQQVAERRGELQRGLGLRGLGGSSFGEQSVTSFDLDSQRALQDASANVEMQQLQALTGIDASLAENMFGKISTQAQLNGESQAIAKARLEQELRALGLSNENIKMASDTYESYSRRLNDAQPRQTGHSAAVSGSAGSSIICTAMNETYGFGHYRNKIWVKYGVDHLTEEHRLGYHYLFLPLVKFGFKSGDGFMNLVVRKALEHIARRRTTDLRAVMRGYKRDKIGMVYRAVLEPLCFVFGFLVTKNILKRKII